eukprot:7895692-Pyramimonas_sp.AAC.1
MVSRVVWAALAPNAIPGVDLVPRQSNRSRGGTGGAGAKRAEGEPTDGGSGTRGAGEEEDDD